MNSPEIHRWNADARGDLTVEAVKAIHQPSQRHRVSLYQYPAGTSTGGSMMAGVAYVQNGRCAISYPNCELELDAGQFADCPGGSYELTVVGASDLRIIFAWALPFDIAT